MDMESVTQFRHLLYSDSHKAEFFNTLNDAAKLFGCQYISYVYEEPKEKLRLGFTTNPDWQAKYIEEGLINDCHLWKSVLKYFVNTHRPVFIFPWDSAMPESNIEQSVSQARDAFDIGKNGISFCAQNETKREFLAFAPSVGTPQFAQNMLKNLESVRAYAGIFRAATKEVLQATQQGEHA